MMLNWLANFELLGRRQTPFRVAAMATIAVSTLLTDVSKANVVGSDTQNFNPVTSGLDFVTVQSSETLKPGFINFGLFLNHAVNTLPYFDLTEGRQGRTKFNDSVLGLDLNFGVGILTGWDVGVSFPHVIYQDVEKGGFHGQFGDKGNTEVRINTKVRLLGDDSGGVALVGSANINRLKDNPFLGKDAGPTYNIELAMDTTVRRIALGLNLGYRARSVGKRLDDETPVDPLNDQVIGSLAASYLFSSIDTKLILEIFGSRPAAEATENSDRLSSSAEALLGIKHDLTTSLAVHGGAGTEILHGQSSPDWRAYLGLNWSVGPTFSKPMHAVKREPSDPAAFGKKDPFAGPPKAEERIVIHDILFEFDSDHFVLSGAEKTLDKLVAYLYQKPVFTRLVIEGHTDSIGPYEYNDDLSRRRAETIKRWLVKRFKINPARIQTQGRGERYPIADNGNYQGRQLNRRVEFVIYRK